MEPVVQENMESVDKTLLAEKIISAGIKQPSPLLFILHGLQDEIGYVPEDAIRMISDSLKLPMPEVLSLVTFHRQFKLKMNNEPENVARNTIRVCSGTPCYTKGSQPVIDKLCELLEIEKGETTKDQRFALEMVDCLGVCGMSPVMMINEDIYGNLTAEDLPEYLDKYK